MPSPDRSSGDQQAPIAPAWREAELHERLATHLGRGAVRPVGEALDAVVADARDCLPGAVIGLTLLRTDDRTPKAIPFTPHSALALEVPVLTRGRTVATLRLEHSDAGSAAAAARCAVMVATTAATIIERARTADENARRDRWYPGGALLARELVSGQHPSPLSLVAHITAEIAEADVVCVLQPDADCTGLIVAASAGNPPTDLREGRVVPAGSRPAQVMSSGTGLSVSRWDDAGNCQRKGPTSNLGAVLVVPLAGVNIRGVLVIGRRPHRTGFTAGELGTATMFASQVALALELVETRSQRDMLVMMEERDRISHELHDEVIQRLFAVGLSLQRAASEVSGAASCQIDAGIEGIDNTIAEVRAVIHQLGAPRSGTSAAARSFA